MNAKCSQYIHTLIHVLNSYSVGDRARAYTFTYTLSGTQFIEHTVKFKQKPT